MNNTLPEVTLEDKKLKGLTKKELDGQYKDFIKESKKNDAIETKHYTLRNRSNHE